MVRIPGHRTYLRNQGPSQAGPCNGGLLRGSGSVFMNLQNSQDCETLVDSGGVPGGSGPSAWGACPFLKAHPHQVTQLLSQTLLCFGVLLLLPAGAVTCPCPLLLQSPCLWGLLQLPDRSSRWLEFRTPTCSELPVTVSALCQLSA